MTQGMGVLGAVGRVGVVGRESTALVTGGRA